MASPIGVEKFSARTVSALVSVSSEIVPLRLQEVSRESGATVAIIIFKGRRQGWHWDAAFYRCGNDFPPALLSSSKFILEIWIQQYVGDVRVLVECLFYLA